MTSFFLFSLPSTGEAFSALMPLSVPSIGFVIGVSLWAASLSGVDLRSPFADSGVLPCAHGLQVLRIHASLVAAFVMYMKRLWNRGYEKSVSQSVCAAKFTIHSNRQAVSVGRDAPSPEPASAHRLESDLGKKTLYRCGNLVAGHCDSPEIAMSRAARWWNTVAARIYFTPEKALRSGV